MLNSLDRNLPVDQSPVFDRHDDPNNEDFVNDKDPEKKFVPINEVEDKDADFTEKMDNKDEVEEDETEDDEEKQLDEAWRAMERDEHESNDNQEALEKVRQDIGHYDHEGPDNVALASFHVDHDNKKTIGVVEEGLESFRPTDPETIKNAPLEEEFADNNIVTDRKMSPGGKPLERVGKHKMGQSNVSDNLKTMPENKIQRNNRGLIRKFLDNVWNKN